MKQFYTFRYSLSFSGRVSTLIIYSDSVENAEDKADQLLRAEYPKGFNLFPQGRNVFATAAEADRGVSHGFFGAINKSELEEYMIDYLEANPDPIKAKRPDRSSFFAKELERRAREFQLERAAA